MFLTSPKSITNETDMPKNIFDTKSDIQSNC